MSFLKPLVPYLAFRFLALCFELRKASSVITLLSLPTFPHSLSRQGAVTTRGASRKGPTTGPELERTRTSLWQKPKRSPWQPFPGVGIRIWGFHFREGFGGVTEGNALWHKTIATYEKIFWNNYFISKNLRIWRVIPLNCLYFLDIPRAQNPSKITKNNSQRIIFAIISCQRVSHQLKTQCLWANLHPYASHCSLRFSA